VWNSEPECDLDLAPSSQGHGFDVGREDALSSESSRRSTLRTTEHGIQGTGLQQQAERPASEDFEITMAVPVSQEHAATPQKDIYSTTAQAYAGDFLSLDPSWEFPCVPTMLSPQAPLFPQHEPITDLDMLMSGGQVWSFRDGSQQQDEFAYMNPAETSPPIQHYLGVFSDPLGDPLPNRDDNLVPGDGEIGAMLHGWDTCFSANTTSAIDGDGQQTLKERQDYRQTLFQTISRLLEMASAS
jgi:hypothetical protein